MSNQKRLEKIKQVNQLLKEIYEQDIERTESIRSVIYSIRGILGEVENYWSGSGIFDSHYIAEKCNLIRLDSYRADLSQLRE